MPYIPSMEERNTRTPHNGITNKGVPNLSTGHTVSPAIDPDLGWKLWSYANLKGEEILDALKAFELAPGDALVSLYHRWQFAGEDSKCEPYASYEALRASVRQMKNTVVLGCVVVEYSSKSAP
jgi:hypothetical protein